MSGIELKSCPCCGGRAEPVNGTDRGYIRCNACGLRTDEYIDEHKPYKTDGVFWGIPKDYDFGEKGIVKAVNVWNART